MRGSTSEKAITFKNFLFHLQNSLKLVRQNKTKEEQKKRQKNANDGLKVECNSIYILIWHESDMLL